MSVTSERGKRDGMGSKSVIPGALILGWTHRLVLEIQPGFESLKEEASTIKTNYFYNLLEI